MVIEIVAQIMGFLTAALTLLSYQFNRGRIVILIQTGATLCNGVAYLLLGATSGCVLMAICLARNLCFSLMEKPSRLKYVLVGIFVILMGGASVLSWQGPATLLVSVGLMLNTVALSLNNPQLLRWSILITSPMILTYNVIVFSLGGVLNESVAVVSSVVGILRFRKGGKKANEIQ